MTKSERIDNVDLVKAIAICLVLALHTELFKFNFIEDKTFLNIIGYCFRIILEGVPFFAFINGLLLFRKTDIDIKKHYKKCLKILLLVLIWGLLLTFLGFLISNNKIVDFKYLFNNLLEIKVGNDYNGILWFLLSLLNVYLLYPVLLFIHKKTIHFLNI